MSNQWMMSAVAIVTVAITLTSTASTVAAAADDSGSGGGSAVAAAAKWDSRGYIYFCPCMGRFGNQIEYYLGVLRLAKELDRTLILPPFIVYTNRGGREFPRFSHIFNVTKLAEYHRVIEAHEFLSTFGGAGQPYAPEKRVAYCWGQSTTRESSTCDLKRGQPSIDFWGHQKLEYTIFENYQLGTAYNPESIRAWNQRFPLKQHPVLAFSGSPAPLPMDRANYFLQQYLVWTDALQAKAQKFIAKKLPRPYLAAHLRTGEDWRSSCKSADGSRSWMSAIQCLHDVKPPEKAVVSQPMCFQDAAQAVFAIKNRVQSIAAKTVFIATDAKDYIQQLKAEMPDVNFVKYTDPNGGDDPTLDLILLGESDYFLGNCVSSYTAMIKRQRDLKGRASGFFGIGENPVSAEAAEDGSKKKKKKKKNRREEL